MDTPVYTCNVEKSNGKKNMCLTQLISNAKNTFRFKHPVEFCWKKVSDIRPFEIRRYILYIFSASNLLQENHPDKKKHSGRSFAFCRSSTCEMSGIQDSEVCWTGMSAWMSTPHKKRCSFQVGDTSSKGPCFIAMLVYQSVNPSVNNIPFNSFKLAKRLRKNTSPLITLELVLKQS